MVKSIFQNAYYNVVYSVLNLLFPLISSIYVSRILFADGVGIVAYANNIMSYFLSVAALGLPTYGMKEIARSQRGEHRDQTFTQLLIINSISTLLCCFGYYTMILVMPYFKSQISLYTIVGISLILNIINVDWFYRGIEEYRYIVIRSALIKIISLIFLFIFVRKKEDYVIYALLSCVSTAGNYIFNIMHIRKFVSLDFNFKLKDMKKHVLPLFFLLVSVIAAELYSRIDLTMLGILCNSSVVGYYANAVKIFSIILTVVVSISAVMLPKLSLLYKNKNIMEFNKLINIVLNVLLVFGFPAVLGVWLLAEDFMQVLYGANFLPSAMTLKILSLLFIIKGVGDLIAYQVVVAINKEKYFPLTRLVTLVINIVLNWILISKYEHNGAAIASVISELVTFLIIFVLIRKNIKIKIEIKDIISIILANLAMYIILKIIIMLNIYIVTKLVLCVLLGTFTYFLFIWIFKNSIIKFIFIKD